MHALVPKGKASDFTSPSHHRTTTGGKDEEEEEGEDRDLDRVTGIEGEREERQEKVIDAKARVKEMR